MIAQGLADDAAEVVQRVILRVFRDENVEVGQCLAVPAEPDQGLRTAVSRSVQIRFGDEDTAEICRSPGRAGSRPGRAGHVGIRASRSSGVRSSSRPKAASAPGQVARFLVRLAQQPGGIGIVRMNSEPMFEVGDRFAPFLLLGEQPAAVDQGFGIVGLGGEPAVHLGQLSGAASLGLDDFAQTTRTGLGGGSGPAASLAAEAVGYGGASQSSPIGVSWSRIRRRSHTSAVFWLVLATSFVPSGLKTSGVGVTGCNVVSRASSRPVAASASST